MHIICDIPIWDNYIPIKYYCLHLTVCENTQNTLARGAKRRPEFYLKLLVTEWMFLSMMFVNSSGIFIWSYSQMFGRIGFGKFSTLLTTWLLTSWGSIEEKIEAIRGPPPWVPHHSALQRRGKTTARMMCLLLFFLLAPHAHGNNIGITSTQVSHVRTSYRKSEQGWFWSR